MGVQRQDLVEAGHGHQHPARMRHGAAREARAGASGHQRHLQASTEQDDLAHLFFGTGQHHHRRKLTIGTQAIAFVRAQIFLAVKDAALRHDLLQASDERLQPVRRQRAGAVLPGLHTFHEEGCRSGCGTNRLRHVGRSVFCAPCKAGVHLAPGLHAVVISCRGPGQQESRNLLPHRPPESRGNFSF